MKTKIKNEHKNRRWRVDFNMGISPFHWTEYVTARDENGAEKKARETFNLNGRPLGWVNSITKLN